MTDGETGPGPGLAILDDPCRGCGACCEYVGVPPGYAVAFEPAEEAPAGWWRGFDGRTLLAMPAELREPLAAYYRAVAEGSVEDRERAAVPCLWYDPLSRRCSHYEWRPGACRDFEAGGDDCLGIRDYAGR